MPRKIIGAAFISLDGVMQAPGGPDEDPSGGFAYGGWLAPLGDQALGNQIQTLFAQPCGLLLGRRTYDIFAAYWPFVSAENWIAELFARIGKYVVTGSEMPLDWQGSERLADIDAVARLKAGGGPDLIIQGSSTLYPQLLARGLIDRLVLMTAPVILGSGKKLFGADTAPATFRLVEHRLSSTGISMATYDRNGDVQTGTFAEQEPSEAELARRETLAQTS